MAIQTPPTGKLNRQVLQNLIHSKFNQDVLWNAASLVILALGGMVSNLFIVRYQGTEALGVFNQVYAIYIVVSQLGVGGLQFSVLKYISHNPQDRPQCSDILSSALILVTGFSVIFCLVGYFLADLAGAALKSPGVGLGLKFVAPGLVFFTLNKVMATAINGVSHMKAYAVFRSLRYLFIPTLVLVIIWMDLAAPYLALALTFTEIMLFLGMAAYINVKMFPFSISAKTCYWFSQHISFGLRGVFSGVLIELNTRIDVLMLGYFSTDAVVGIYSFASTMAEGFGQLPLALRWNIDPIMGRHFAERREDKISAMAVKVKRYFYPLMAVITLGAVVCYPILLQLWAPGDDIAMSAVVFAIIMLGVLINAGYRPFSGIMLQGGRPGAYTLFITALVVGDAFLNLLFIPAFGIYGAAFVTLITYVAEVILLAFYARRLFGVKL